MTKLNRSFLGVRVVFRWIYLNGAQQPISFTFTAMSKQFLFLLVICLSISCSRRSSDNSSKTVFRYNEPGGISSLDPVKARNLENIWAVNQLFDGLVSLNGKMQPIPAIAKSWTVDSTGILYTFYLKTNVFFHSSHVFGASQTRKVVAADIAYSLQRLVAKETASPGRWVLDGVARNDEGNLNIVCKNDSVLSIELKQASPQFLSLLAMQYCAVVPKEAIDFYGSNFRANPVGCGPFQFFIWEEGVKLVLHKNPNYYKKQLPYLDAVSVSFIKDQSAALMAMQRGDFDFMSGLDAASKQRVLSPTGQLTHEFKSGFYTLKTPFLKTDYLGVRLGNAHILNEVKLRKALSMAINRNDLVNFVLNGIGTPALSGFVPPSLWNQEVPSHPNFEYNPDKAKAIITALGGIKEPITISTTAGALEVCEYIQNRWNAIGIPCQVEVMPASHHREQTSGGNLPLFRKSWIADYPDPENFLSLFYGKNEIPNGPNYFFFQNASFDSLYIASGKAQGIAREAILHQMNTTVNNQLPVIPLFYDQVLQLCSKKVKNLKADGMNVLDLSEVRLEN